MYFKDEIIKQAIKEGKLADAIALRKWSADAKNKKMALEDYVLETKSVSEENLFKAIAEVYKIPYMDLKNQIIRKDILYIVPPTIASTYLVAPIEKTTDELKLATLCPTNLQTFEFIARKSGLKTKIYLTSPSGLESVLKQYRSTLKAEIESISALTGEDKKLEEDQEKLKKLAEDLPVIRIVDSILEHAIYENASDIHIEPGEQEVNIRYRVDGILRNVMTLPKTVLSGIVARIKILSNLKLDEHRMPQDGRFKIVAKDYRYSIRVSIFPIFDGEKIVLRLLPETASALSLEALGLLPKPLDIVKRNIKRPHGIILVTGPTGSGKTTTLYSILGILNTPKVNISTVEDPIEYKMPNVNQSQINPKIGFTFAQGLRALLRQDPNIIMVGEIRDAETADIAINAAMTGHLVLSTLHTNDAVTSLPRLIDMGVPSFLVSYTANLIIAQRLVRKVCKNCAKPYKLSNEETENLGKMMNVEKILKHLKKLGLLKAGDTPKNLTFYRGEGCRTCGSEGYKGRLGIYEVLEITPAISKLIHTQATTDELKKAADEQDMITLAEDGFYKAVKGITSLEEVVRVTKE